MLSAVSANWTVTRMNDYMTDLTTWTTMTQVKAGMVCLQCNNCVIHTSALQRRASHNGVLYKSIYLSFAGQQWSYLLLMIWNDAAHKVGVGIIQRLHQFAQLFLVRLSNGSEHSLACRRTCSTEWTGFGDGGCHADNVRCSDKCIQLHLSATVTAGNVTYHASVNTQICCMWA